MGSKEPNRGLGVRSAACTQATQQAKSLRPRRQPGASTEGSAAARQALFDDEHLTRVEANEQRNWAFSTHTSIHQRSQPHADLMCSCTRNGRPFAMLRHLKETAALRAGVPLALNHKLSRWQGMGLNVHDDAGRGRAPRRSLPAVSARRPPTPARRKPPLAAPTKGSCQAAPWAKTMIRLMES